MEELLEEQQHLHVAVQSCAAIAEEFLLKVLRLEGLPQRVAILEERPC
jgi:hypothetical protein